MGKKNKKLARKQRQQRENDDFDIIEMGEDPKVEQVKNQPKIIGLSKKARKKAKNRLKLKSSVLGDMDMDEVATNATNKQSK